MSEQQKRKQVVMSAGGGAHTAVATWRPLADVYRVQGGWMVKFELAGVTPEDMHIYANSRRLTVSGVRRDTVHETSRGHYLMEISYNRFERTIELPCEFDSSQLLVEYRNGILIVRIHSDGDCQKEEEK